MRCLLEHDVLDAARLQMVADGEPGLAAADDGDRVMRAGREGCVMGDSRLLLAGFRRR